MMMDDTLNLQKRTVVPLTKTRNTNEKLGMMYLEDSGYFQLEIPSMQLEMGKWS